MLKNRLDYGIILLCALLFFLCFDGYLSLFVLAAVIAAPLLSLLVSLPALLGVRGSLSAGPVSVDGPYRAAKGQQVSLLLTVENRFPFAGGRGLLVLQVRNTLTGESRRETLAFTPGREPVRVPYRLSSARSGQVTVQVRRAKVTDYMGLFARRLPLEQSVRAVNFYPTAHGLLLQVEQSAASDSEGERFSQQKPGDDPAELFAFREYREGDRLSRIHWKLSQKAGQLLVKELGLPLSDRIFFLLEMNGGGEEADALLDAFASLSAFLSARGIPHRVGFRPGADQPLTVLEILAPEDVRPVLDALLTVGAAETAPLRPEELPRGASRMLYLCCTPSQASLDALRLGIAGASVSVLCTPSGLEPLRHMDAPVEHRLLLPGQIPESLKGFSI